MNVAPLVLLAVSVAVSVAVPLVPAPRPNAVPVADRAARGGPCRTARPLAVLAPDNEPGDRLVISGRVFQPDGTTPAANVVLYAYQTDRTGVYAREPGAAPRLRGWARTAQDGSYELRTIRPGSYPGTRIAAHIHIQLWGDAVAPQWSRDIQFDDDPFVGDAERAASAAAGRFAWIHRPERAAAEPDARPAPARIVHDIRLSPSGDTFEPNTRHGLEACRERPAGSPPPDRINPTASASSRPATGRPCAASRRSA